jgi:hypothetical protein
MDWKMYQHLKKKDNINEFKPFVSFEIRGILLVPSVLKYREATFEMGECKGYLLVGFVKNFQKLWVYQHLVRFSKHPWHKFCTSGLAAIDHEVRTDLSFLCKVSSP